MIFIVQLFTLNIVANKKSVIRRIKGFIQTEARRTNRWQWLVSIVLLLFAYPYFEYSLKILLGPPLYDFSEFLHFFQKKQFFSYFNIYRAFPELALAWLPGIIFFIYVIIVGEKSKDRTGKIWLVILFSYLIFPIIYNEITYRLLLGKYLFWVGGHLPPSFFSSEGFRGYFQNMLLFGYWPWTVGLLLILVTYKKFNQKKSLPLDKLTKAGIAVLTCLLIGIPLVISLTGFSLSKITNSGIETIKNTKETFYTPAYLPKSYVQEFPHQQKENPTKGKYFLSNYNIDKYRLPKLEDYSNPDREGFMLIYQYPNRISQNQELIDTLKKYSPLSATISARIIDISFSKYTKAITQRYNQILSLTFATDLNSIINISSYNQPESELLQIAKNLKPIN